MKLPKNKGPDAERVNQVLRAQLTKRMKRKQEQTQKKDQKKPIS
jgi:hypothetical protein